MGFMHKAVIAGFGIAALVSGQALAEDAKDAEVEADAPMGANSVNLNPLGVLFGSYSVNYERLFDRQHGLLVEAGFSSSEDSNGDTAFATGALVGYRWHWSQSQDSGFLGANVGYYLGEGEASVNNSSFKVDYTTVDITLNGGRRYAWKSGFNLTWRLGVGRAFRSFEAQDDSEGAKEAAQLIEDIVNFLPVTIDAELSIGWVF